MHKMKLRKVMPLKTIPDNEIVINEHRSKVVRSILESNELAVLSR